MIALLILSSVIFCYCKRRAYVEEPTIDDNMYYNNPGDDYEYGTTAFTDNNDYYD